LLDGMVLDGWNRYQACERLGIDFNYLEFEYEFPDLSPEDYVLSKNLHRRHMTDSQRAASVVAVSRWVPNGRPNNLAQRASFSTNAELAQRADVSERTISRAKVAHEAGLGDAVIAGEMTLRQAEEAAKPKRAQKADVEHESAGELAARTDAIAKKPTSRVDPVEDSSKVAPSQLDVVISECAELRSQLSDVATTARELEAEVEAYRAGERGEGEKQLVEANKRIAKLESEIRRLEAIRDDWMNKHAEALKQIKRLQRQLERGHA